MAEAMDGEPLALRRSRREKKKSRASDRLEQIRRARETGVVEEEENLETAEGLFNYVTEEEYGEIVQQRQREGWILNDDGSYREHGREIFDEEVNNEVTLSDKENKKARRKVARPSSDIKNLVLNMAGRKRPAQQSISTKDDPLLAELLMKIDESTPQQLPKRPKQKSFTPRTPTSATRVVVKQERREHTPSPPPPPPPPYYPSLPSHNNGLEDSNMFTDSLQELADNGVVEEEEKEEEVKEDKVLTPAAAGNDGVTSRREAVPEAAVSCSGWETVRESLDHSASSSHVELALDSTSLPVVERDEGERVLPFYWLDAYEDSFNQPGTVFLFGKVWIEEASAHVSCCVVVKNIERCLYFLPREKLLSDKGKPTEHPVTMEDVYAEFNQKYADPFKILRFTSKRVTKKYAFEKPDVPAESEYLEVRYSADYSAPPISATGRSFSHVFGTNTSSLERLILFCKLKGPCWLEIKRPRECGQHVSWCKVECIADGPNLVGVASEQTPPPPITILSLSMKTVMNATTRTNEVLCVGGLVHPSVSLDKPASQVPFRSDFCTMRRPSNRQFPYKFHDHMKKKGLNLEITSSERSLMAYLLAKLHKIDPDIIIGHNISSLWLDTLQHRMWACKVPHWSRIGRLKRQAMPKGRSSSQSLCCGRVLCDVKLSAKELIRARSYDLTELASSLLSVKYHPMSDEDVLASFSHHESLGALVTHTMDEAMLALRLTHELCVLPLAYQITCIAGNTLGRTLQGGRSERNEFLLLHAFTQQGYICPDKAEFGHKASLPVAHDDEEGEPAPGASKSSRRKPAYAGGLVLDPRVGFYNRLILLLDFNSLYPSIIQEYNICFTTLDHAHCTSDEDYSSLQPPGTTVPAGILPSEIRVLVQRRREVKRLMAKQCSPEQRQQYDIRQKALKLTANSMYGCLGFSHSRFLAKPLAALITGKGREILSHTRDLAVKLGLEVIYGDTDSIMIDSGTQDLKQAQEMAQSVKAEVNKYYRLLEIDIDGIFKTMLLLKKKKYAAIALDERDGHIVERRELKGLDIVRRDWSGLAKHAGHYVLDQILSGASIDELIHTVQSFLTKLKEDIHMNQIELEKFIITKSLTKPPQDYPDRKSLPHVQVALRMMSRNIPVQAGDVIPYIVCEGDAGQSSAQRSFHPEEVKAQQLTIDVHYYLQHQIHAVVTRLCEPIEGLDAAQLAQCLGLDPAAYRSQSNRGEGTDEHHHLLTLSLPDTHTDPLTIVCPQGGCGAATQIKLAGGGFACDRCCTPFSVTHLSNALSLGLRSAVARYYQGWLVCGDCQQRTCSLPLSLLCPSCGRGKLHEEYSSAALYKQLQGFKELFSDEQYKAVRALAESYLENSAYTNINLHYLFPALRS